MSNLKILSVSAYAPENVVSNHDLSKVVETSDEWIRTRTGICNRRVAIEEDTSDLAYKASLEALEKSGLKAEEIDLIIVSSTAPDYHTPSVACKVQGKLKAKNAVAFDISAACTGLIYALKIADQFSFDSKYKNILVICSEVLSKIIDWKDRNTCVLFGDGASAMVLQKDIAQNGIVSVDIFSDGEYSESLTCRTRSNVNPYSNSENENHYIGMDGKAIFKFATTVLVDGIRDVLEKNNLSIDDIKYIVPHQANIRMFEYCSKKLNIGLDKFYTNISEYGNTSSASIGIALNELVENQLIQRGDKLIFIGFGGGLTWGYSLVEY